MENYAMLIPSCIWMILVIFLKLDEDAFHENGGDGL